MNYVILFTCRQIGKLVGSVLKSVEIRYSPHPLTPSPTSGRRGEIVLFKSPRPLSAAAREGFRYKGEGMFSNSFLTEHAAANGFPAQQTASCYTAHHTSYVIGTFCDNRNSAGTQL